MLIHFAEIDKGSGCDNDLHQFPPAVFRGVPWNFDHLSSYAIQVDIGAGCEVEVFIQFSCHCFTHSLSKDPRGAAVPADEVYVHGGETRILNELRYELSRKYLGEMVSGLPTCRIHVANIEQGNFLTWQLRDVDGNERVYGVFFIVKRDRKRARKLILLVQSAYIMEAGLTKRQREAKKVGWLTLIKAAWEGRKIRP